MDTLGMKQTLEILNTFGISGLVLLLWYFSMRHQQRILDQYRDDQLQRDAQIREIIGEIRSMYEHNAELVKVTQRLALDQKDLVLMNTQALTKVCEKIDQNQYCPAVRLEKRAKGVQQ